LNNNSIENAVSVNSNIYDCLFVDSTLLAYSTTYNSLGKLVLLDLITYNDYVYFSAGISYNIRIYPEQNRVFFSNTYGIFEIRDKGASVLNHTQEHNYTEIQSPALIRGNNLLAYDSYSSNNISMIILKNLDTYSIDTLYSIQGRSLKPIFATEDESRLIFIELELPSSGNDGIKSLNLNNVQDVQLLTDRIPSNPTLEKSVNDKTAFVSDGIIYVLDLNTAEIKSIATGGEFASISNNGEKVVFTTQTELFIINTDGTNQQKLISKVAENKYLFLPSFSSDDEQIVFVESDYPYYPNYQ